ncbi:protein CROWDED NUCLEI 4 isoform X2 [Aplysia californica]|uniref:Protein CROWDED NUCLEI 4 isoform X2 n=1 Tax=Aplysia californica TaxID=6500 RepID=A0ABM0JBJ1_APLCA|nr:protein CROWDED NUCLEI 4 isoform X2 [Aplysia californica]
MDSESTEIPQKYTNTTTETAFPRADQNVLQLGADLTSDPDESTVMSKKTLTPRVPGGAMAVEEERDALRQHVSNLKVVLKEMYDQLSVYKNRCAGVDTVSLMLRESKRDVIKLSKQCKVLETAVANLQNRLSTNGLSSSVNIEETELFVPGPSKQTLDNLARENARLRSQLKNSENPAGKKVTEDVQSMKASLEKLEAENNQLKAQLFEMENMKMRIVQQYEMELKTHSENVAVTRSDISVECKETQTFDLPQSLMEVLRTSLKQVSEQCVQLQSQLEKTQMVKEEQQKRNETNEKELGITEEKYAELQRNYEKVVLMNHRWQSHSDNKEKEVHALQARISELEEADQMSHMINAATDNLKQEITLLRVHLDHKEAENVQLRRSVQECDKLKQEVAAQRQQPQFDMSIVEILKQQIQVCTEDFNNERKDREKAVNKAKQLQEEVNRLLAENNAVKTESDFLKKQMLHQTIRPDYSRMNQLPVFQARGHQPAILANRALFDVRGRAPVSSTGSSSLSPSSSMSTPPETREENNAAGGPYSRGSSRDSGVGPDDPSELATGAHQLRNAELEFLSLPRNVGGDSTDEVLEARTGLTSMPPPRRRPQKNGEKGEYMTCPKCNKEFSESQNKDLLNHMEVCTD